MFESRRAHQLTGDTPSYALPYAYHLVGCSEPSPVRSAYGLAQALGLEAIHWSMTSSGQAMVFGPSLWAGGKSP